MSNFVVDLVRGQRGESLLLEMFPSLTKATTRDYDLVTAAGLKLETKFDSTKHENIFLEVMSNTTKRSPGGPLQSMFKGADYFIYIFERDNSMHCYRVVDLVWFLFDTKGTYKDRRVWNKNYTTVGYAVPISDLKHLEIPLESII
jgi:hypothetical protein